MSDTMGSTWRDAAGTLHLDVRDLPAPEPLVATLRLIDTLASPEPVVFHHDRDPGMLYPELAERGWHAEPLPAAAGEVQLRLLPPATGG